MSTDKITYLFPQSTPPQPRKRLPVRLRFLTLAIAYLRVCQAMALLPLILPFHWHMDKVLMVSVYGAPVPPVDTLAALRERMDNNPSRKRQRIGLVELAETIDWSVAA